MSNLWFAHLTKATNKLKYRKRKTNRKRNQKTAKYNSGGIPIHPIKKRRHLISSPILLC